MVVALLGLDHDVDELSVFAKKSAIGLTRFFGIEKRNNFVTLWVSPST